MVKNKPTTLNAGMRTLTDAQYAVMFLLHKGKTSELQQPYRSMDAKNVRIHAGLSDQTVRHQLRRLSIILDGQEDLILTSGDEYYETLLSRMQDGEEMDPNELRRDIRLALRFTELGATATAELAMDAFTDENKEIGEYYYNKNLEAQSKYAQDRKQKETTDKRQIQQFVSDYIKAFNAKLGFSAAKQKAIDLASTKFGKKVSDIKKIVNDK